MYVLKEPIPCSGKLPRGNLISLGKVKFRMNKYNVSTPAMYFSGKFMDFLLRNEKKIDTRKTRGAYYLPKKAMMCLNK